MSAPSRERRHSLPAPPENGGPPSGASQATVYLVPEPARGTPATTQTLKIVVPVAAILSKNQDDANSKRFRRPRDRASRGKSSRGVDSTAPIAYAQMTVMTVTHSDIDINQYIAPVCGSAVIAVIVGYSGDIAWGDGRSEAQNPARSPSVIVMGRIRPQSGVGE